MANKSNNPEQKNAFASNIVAELSQSLNNTGLNLLTQLFNTLPEGVLLITPQGLIEYANPTAAKLLTDTQAALLGKNVLNFLHEPYRDKYLYTLLSWLDIQTSQLNYGPHEVSMNIAGDKLISLDLSISSLPNSITGDNPIYICLLHDITCHKEKYNELEKIAHTDFLTGLANRHTLQQQLKKHWQHCLTTNQPISTILIDVDYFKLFNDRFGHVKGDKCLQEIAKIIKHNLPSRDCIAARYGGEEFLVLLPYCHQNNAAAIAKQIQTQVNELALSCIGLPGDERISVSQGIACEFNNQYRTSEALICAADTALYRAKAAGRNKISISV